MCKIMLLLLIEQSKQINNKIHAVCNVFIFSPPSPFNWLGNYADETKTYSYGFRVCSPCVQIKR